MQIIHRIQMKIVKTFMALLVVLLFMPVLSGQTVMSILPVNYTAIGYDVLNAQQWQEVSVQMQDQFVVQLAGIGSVSKLSKEHLLLLLKDMQPADPENLSADEYKTISRKENLHYLLKCSIKSAQIVNKDFSSAISVVIVEGNSGKVFWEKDLTVSKTLTSLEDTDHILLQEIYKPAIKGISLEIRELKY
jgi:hypothetical protein